MKNAYIIHGWGHDSNMPWIKWLKKELKKKGVNVNSLDMPNTDEPTIEEWVSHLKENVVEPNEHTYFIAHSIGAQTVMRFLEKEHKHLKIAGCVFIAPWIDLIGLGKEELKIAHPWLNNKINFERVKDHTGNINCIFSTNDPYVSEKEWKKFEENLNAKIIIKRDFEHFEETKRILRFWK